MNFMFLFIAFANIIPECLGLEISDILNRNYNDDSKESLSLTEARENKGKKTLKQQLLLPVINNTGWSTTSNFNLKSNIFDKMLSEEMLSIKQHFYEKDSTQATSVKIAVKSKVATPTLEVKQMWPLENLFSKSLKNVGNKNEPLLKNRQDFIYQNFLDHETSSQSTHKDFDYENVDKDQVKNKVVGLRSLHESVPLKGCNCMETNPSPSFNHRSSREASRRENNICAHTPNELHVPHRCTRTEKTESTLLSYPGHPVYVTYPYFWVISTFTVSPYYHPNPINEIKKWKTRRRHKKKKPHYVVEDYNAKYHDDYEENYMNSINDEYFSKLSKHESTESIDILSDIEYDKNTPKKHSVDMGSFIDDAVVDLKKHCSSHALNDCYCSLSSKKYVFNIILYLSLICNYLTAYF